jgi:hypothetical protein
MVFLSVAIVSVYFQSRIISLCETTQGRMCADRFAHLYLERLDNSSNNTATKTRVYGPYACPWCAFGFSMEVLQEIHLERCEAKHLGTFCNGCGRYIHCSEKEDLQQHMATCLARFEEDSDSERVGSARNRKKQQTHPPSSASATSCPASAYVKEMEEDLQVRAAELESLTELMRSNPSHASAVIYDNFESAAMKLEALYREARTDWLQRTEHLKAIKAAAAASGSVQNSVSVKKEEK